MGKVRSPDSLKAEKMFMESNGRLALVNIARKLNVSDSTVRSWKNRYKWQSKLNVMLQEKNRCNSEKKKCDSESEKVNNYSETHVFFSKFLPEETLEIMQEIEQKNPLDILWENITIQYAAIIKLQKIMHVTYKNKVKSEWERQANFLQAQSKAMAELRGLIKQYNEMLNTNWDLATEEQKLRIQKLKVDIEKVQTGQNNNKPIEIVIKRKGEGKC